MAPLERMDWEILNATADDWESLETIIALLQATLTENSVFVPDVQSGLARLTSTGLLEARQENGTAENQSRTWYRMTESGRRVWQDSEFASQLN
jgi:hypothetical protein